MSTVNAVSIRRVLQAALLLVVVSPVGHALDWHYTLRYNDTLNSLCERYLRGPQWTVCALELANYNQLADPYKLQQGQVIKVPYRWLKRPPQAATLVFATGVVRYFGASNDPQKINSAAGSMRAQALPADGKIQMGDRISTGDGNARVLFADGSELIIRPNSDVIFDRLSVYDGYGYVDTMLILKRGATVNRVDKQARGTSRFSISTPAGIAAVRGTEFRISTEQLETAVMRSEVLEGLVAVNDSSGSSGQYVAQGYGLKSEVGAPPPSIRELLPAPQWLDEETGRISMPYTLGWQAVAGAQAYMVDVVDASGSMQVETVTNNSLALDQLALGEYRVALRAIDGEGLQGLEANRTISVLNAVPRPQLQQAGMVATSGTRAKLAWPALQGVARYRVEVSRDAGFSSLVESTESSEPQYLLRSWRPLYIRVQAVAEDGRSSAYSATVQWQPTVDYSPWIFSFFSVILVVIAL